MTQIIVLIILAIAIFYLVKNKTQANHQAVQKELAAKMYGSNKQSDDDLLKNLENETRRVQAFIQANIVGDKFVADAINAGTYNGPLPEKRDDGGWLSIFDNLRILKIAGINYRSGIARYVGRVECALVPEPDNEYDPNAIKVIAEDRHHLGYIPTDQTDFVRSLAANEFPYRCTAFIDEREDELDGHKFFIGFVYIKRLD
jgi:hypothetical protein